MSYGYDNYNADFAPGAILNTAGYPATGGYDGRRMEFSYGGIAGLSPDGLAIQYRQTSITAFAGQSGSPVWRYTPSNGASVVYGVHVGGDGVPSSVNFATRITQSIFNDLQNWRAADRLPILSIANAAPAYGTVTQSISAPSWSTRSGNAQSVMVSPWTTPADHDLADDAWSRVTVAADHKPLFSFASDTPSGTNELSHNPPSLPAAPDRAPALTAPAWLASFGHDVDDDLWDSGAVLAVRSYDMASAA
jgi:hypothetical protein